MVEKCLVSTIPLKAYQKKTFRKFIWLKRNKERKTCALGKQKGYTDLKKKYSVIDSRTSRTIRCSEDCSRSSHKVTRVTSTAIQIRMSMMFQIQKTGL